MARHQNSFKVNMKRSVVSWTWIFMILFASSTLFFGSSAQQENTSDDVDDNENVVPITSNQQNNATGTETEPVSSSVVTATPDSEESRDNDAETPPTTTPAIGRPDILGCMWPADFATRYQFCLKQAKLPPLKDSSEKQIQYGLLNGQILDLVMKDCDKNNLGQCVKPIEPKLLDKFDNTWKNFTNSFEQFEKCLQSNTEAMNRLCGSDSEIGRVVSGAAGLQLNLIGALVRIRNLQLDNKNVSENCFRKMSESIHITAGLYLSSKHFMDNSVLCWNVVHQGCRSDCSSYAAELNCLKAACPNVPLRVFQEFGIWQWYYLNTKTVKDQCKIDDDKCKPVDETNSLSGAVGAASLFDMNNIKKKWKEMEKNLEDTFNLPFHILFSIALAFFFAFIASVILLCLWRYKIICKTKKRSMRYSRLTDDIEGPEGDSSLLKQNHDDID